MNKAAFYPVLAHLPSEEQQAYIEKAERAVPLTAEQAGRLGLPAHMEIVLLPSELEATTTLMQREGAFPHIEALISEYRLHKQHKPEINAVPESA